MIDECDVLLFSSDMRDLVEIFFAFSSFAFLTVLEEEILSFPRGIMLLALAEYI